MDFSGVKMRMFPIDDPMKVVNGTIINTGGYHKLSATDGPLIYLNGNPDVQQFLDRVVAAGGQIEVPQKEINPK